MPILWQNLMLRKLFWRPHRLKNCAARCSTTFAGHYRTCLMHEIWLESSFQMFGNFGRKDVWTLQGLPAAGYFHRVWWATRKSHYSKFCLSATFILFYLASQIIHRRCSSALHRLRPLYSDQDEESWSSWMIVLASF